MVIKKSGNFIKKVLIINRLEDFVIGLALFFRSRKMGGVRGGK